MGTAEKAIALAVKRLEQERDQVAGDYAKKIDALNEALSVIGGVVKKPTRRKTAKKATKKIVKAKKTARQPAKAKKVKKAPKQTAKAKKTNGTPRNGTLQKAIVDVLSGAKDPIHVNEILETLASKGYKIEKRNLATRLSTMKKSKLVDNSAAERGFWHSA